MKEIFNITDPRFNRMPAKLKVEENHQGTFVLQANNYTDGCAAIVLTRAELLEMARTIIQKLDMVLVQPLGGDVMLIPLHGQVEENDIVKVAPAMKIIGRANGAPAKEAYRGQETMTSIHNYRQWISEGIVSGNPRQCDHDYQGKVYPRSALQCIYCDDVKEIPDGGDY